MTAQTPENGAGAGSGRIAGMVFPDSRPGHAGPGVPVGVLKPADLRAPRDEGPAGTAKAPSVERRRTAKEEALIRAWRRKAGRT